MDQFTDGAGKCNRGKLAAARSLEGGIDAESRPIDATVVAFFARAIISNDPEAVNLSKKLWKDLMNG